MDKLTRVKKLLGLRLAVKDWTVALINRGEQVQYFDGVRYVEGEVSWDWKEPIASGGIPTRIPPLHVYVSSLTVANPPGARGPLSIDEQLQIAERICSALIEKGTEAILDSTAG